MRHDYPGRLEVLLATEKIEKTLTFGGYLGRAVNYFLFVLVVLIIINLTSPEDSQSSSYDSLFSMLSVVALVPMTILAIIRAIQKQRWLKQRGAALDAYAKTYSLHYQPAAYEARGVLLEELGLRGQKCQNLIKGDDWRYFDYSYDIYRQIRSGEYKAEIVHYAVISFDLPRGLPHVFFDSIASRKRQFRFQIDANQRHRLEGNFDTYFDTYFPGQYSVDSLSFITPEVMQAMIEAQAYDIEINGSKLYLYGPLLPMPKQLESLYRLGSVIRQKLLNNIVTYRDERIAYDKGRQTVAPLGLQLNKNVQKFIPVIIIGLLLIGVSIVISVVSGRLAVDPLWFGVAIFFGGFIPYSAEMRRRKNIRVHHDLVTNELNKNV
jgi:hypothetical protein